MHHRDIWEEQDAEEKLQILATQISRNPFDVESKPEQLRITTDSSLEETYNFTNYKHTEETRLSSANAQAHYPSTIPSVGSDTRPEPSIQADTDIELPSPQIKAEIKIGRKVEQATQSPKIEDQNSSAAEDSHNFVYSSFEVKVKESAFMPARIAQTGILPHSRPLTVIQKGQRNPRPAHTLQRSIKISKLAQKSTTLSPLHKFKDNKPIEIKGGFKKKLVDEKKEEEKSEERIRGGKTKEKIIENGQMSGKSSKGSFHTRGIFQEPEFKLGASYTFDLRELKAKKERSRVFGHLGVKQRKFSKGLENMDFVKYPYFNSVRPFQWDSPSQILHSSAITRASPLQQTSPSHLVMKLSSTFTSKDVEEYLKKNRPSRPCTTHLRANPPVKTQQLPNSSVQIPSTGVFSRPLTSLDRASLRTSYKFRPGALCTGSVTPSTAQLRRGKRGVGKRKGNHFLQTKIIGSPISLAARDELRQSITGNITREDMKREGVNPPRIPLPLPPPPQYADSIERWENFESDAEQDSIQRFVEKRKYMQRYMQSESQSSAEAAFETELTPKLDLQGELRINKKKQPKQTKQQETLAFQPPVIKEEGTMEKLEKFRTAATYNITFNKDTGTEIPAEGGRKRVVELKREFAQTNPLPREMKSGFHLQSARSTNSGPISPRAIKAIRQSAKMNLRGIKHRAQKRSSPQKQKLRFSIERSEESSGVITEHTEVKDQCVGEDVWLQEEDEEEEKLYVV